MPIVLAFLTRLLAYTWRVEQAPWPVEGPCVVAFWHGEQLPMIARHRHLGLTAMISLSNDGSFLLRVIEALGYQAVRGSTSKGAMAALRAARRVLQGGGRPTLAVDGPRGPEKQVQPGAETLARLEGVPVVYGWVEAKGLRLRSWDRFLIPWPFAKVRIAYGVWRVGEGTLAEAMQAH